MESGRLTMTVRVAFSAHLRAAAGRGHVELSLPEGARIADAVLAAAREAGPKLAEALLDAAGQPRASLLLFLNDEQAAAPQALTDGGEVTIIAPISGG
ncbi:MAG: MoaD/ThiS family protein [Planctomycetota bacterium]|nr:MoaD/ThiS family protein [Planctomycetota bacterium]